MCMCVCTVYVQVLFFGDSMRSGMAPAKKHGWSTVLVLEELRVAGYVHYRPPGHINDLEVEGIDGEHVVWSRFDEVSCSAVWGML